MPDNFKAAFVRATFGAGDRHQLALNRTYGELARHHDCKIDPTPDRSPEKKGKVEASVKYVRRNFLAAANPDSVTAANTELTEWLLRTAGQRMHGSTGKRPLTLFEQDEQAALLALPSVPYEPVVWKQVTVHADSHIEFERRLYSVPWPHVGSKVWLKTTPGSALVYAGDERIATHSRQGVDRRSTNEKHPPPHRREPAERSLGCWLERAERPGPAAGRYVREVAESDEVLSKLRDVQAIVTYLERFPPRRVEGASKRASYFGNYTYAGVRRILERALDLEPLPEERTRHGELSAPRFARTAGELLAHEPGGAA